MGALQKSRGVRRRAEPQNSRDKKEMTASTLQTRKKMTISVFSTRGRDTLHCQKEAGNLIFKKTLRWLLYILWL